MTVFTEQRKEESLMMLWLKDQQQLVMYRLEVGKKRNGSMKTQRVYVTLDKDQAVDLRGGGVTGAEHIINFRATRQPSKVNLTLKIIILIYVALSSLSLIKEKKSIVNDEVFFFPFAFPASTKCST